jgi:CubicO group peptidase (beta-lactamase class C family)
MSPARIATALLAAAILAGCASPPPRPQSVARGDYESVKAYLASLIQYEMKKRDVTGLSIALVDDQTIAWAEGFGYADEAAKIPATSDTVYRAGSVSKLFTATAAMQLAERGRLDIDAPLSAFLPQFSIRSRFPGAGAITARMLMTHHSGLPSNLLQGMWVESPEPFTAVAHRIRDEYAAYPPNYVFSYSNLGFTLLGHAIEQAAGAPFAVQLERSLLQPLGMTGSSFSPLLPSSRWMAKAYRDGVEENEGPLRDVPAGGLNTSVRDLSRFLMMVFADGRSGGERILQPETLREMLRPQNRAVALDQGFQVGLGWMLSGLGHIDIQGAGRVAHHAGATLHYQAQLIALPDHKLGVVVLSNTAGAREAVNKIASESLKLALEAKAGIAPPSRPAAPDSAGSLSREDQDRYAGYYATALGLARVTPNGGRLRAEVSGKSFDLAPRPGGELGVRYRLFGIFPVAPEALAQFGLSRAVVSGREVLLVGSRGQKLIFGERIAPAPIPDAWLRRTGEYEVANGVGDELHAGIEVRQRDGFLTVELSFTIPSIGSLTLALAPLSDSEAIVTGLGMSPGAGETVRAVMVDGEECLAFSGYLARRRTK